MILADSPVIEIAAGTVDDSEAQEVYRNLQVLYGTHTGEQALDRDFGIDISTTDYPQESAKRCLRRSMCAKPRCMSRGRGWCALNGRTAKPTTAT